MSKSNAARFTAGPLQVESMGTGELLVTIGPPTGYAICCVDPYRAYPDEIRRAWAHKLAASPALYEAQRELLEASEDYARLIQVENFDRDDIAVHRAYERLRAATLAARAALAQARGEASK